MSWIARHSGLPRGFFLYAFNYATALLSFKRAAFAPRSIMHQQKMVKGLHHVPIWAKSEPLLLHNVAPEGVPPFLTMPACGLWAAAILFATILVRLSLAFEDNRAKSSWAILVLPAAGPISQPLLDTFRNAAVVQVQSSGRELVWVPEL
jgi:hypothetical protein